MNKEDYLAYIFYRSFEESKGAKIFVRWNCLDESEKEKYRKISSEEAHK